MLENTSTYEVTITREGKWWTVNIPELNIVTQARRLIEVEANAREAIAVTLDVPVDSETIHVTVAVDDIDVTTRVERIREDRARAAELERAAATEATELAADLAGAGVAMRDIGSLLGVSFQRAQQLVTAAR
jgi:predicted RNase H-like HicB family nuclease